MPDRTIGYAEIVAEKLRMVRVFAPRSSAILLDPVFGAAQAVTTQALSGSVGLIVALEEPGYEGGNEARVTPITDGWSVGKIKRLGAAAVKLLLYYHPQAPSAAQQEELVIRVALTETRHLPKNWSWQERVRDCGATSAGPPTTK